MKLMLAPTSTSSSAMWKGRRSNKMWGLSTLMWRFGEVAALTSVMMALLRPAMPAPPSRLPMQLLAHWKEIGVNRAMMTRWMAVTSTRSPIAVELPWHSTAERLLGWNPDCSSALLMHSCCEGPCGAVKLALRPSWFTWLATRHASMLCTSSSFPLAFRTALPQPSPLAKPSADLVKVRQRPFRESIVFAQYAMYPWGPSSRLMPTTSAVPMGLRALNDGSLGAALLSRALCAMLMATMEDEPSVSVTLLGPFRPMICESRELMMELL
mmetsp:Transcript_117949/g.334459  ORF Transcript_117949/g.334459 Transcript_117949/m.334459 type:complete len:268 (-) Transcript_117949:1543-2346(-)